jgi:hypothetical protein
MLVWPKKEAGSIQLGFFEADVLDKAGQWGEVIGQALE